jgi:hypothetical protein
LSLYIEATRGSAAPAGPATFPTVPPPWPCCRTGLAAARARRLALPEVRCVASFDRQWPRLRHLRWPRSPPGSVFGPPSSRLCLFICCPFHLHSPAVPPCPIILRVAHRLPHARLLPQPPQVFKIHAGEPPPGLDGGEETGGSPGTARLDHSFR